MEIATIDSSKTGKGGNFFQEWPFNFMLIKNTLSYNTNAEKFWGGFANIWKQIIN